jgi:hypothetical protein
MSDGHLGIDDIAVSCDESILVTRVGVRVRVIDGKETTNCGVETSYWRCSWG